jgi:conjugative transfer relaxase protein TraI
MLSSSVIKNVSRASHYYSQQDNYYTRDEGIAHSEWWGRGAGELQLSGQVDEAQFYSLLQGKLPNGEQLGKVIDGELKHRAGWDLTLSAPKSVSIMAYIGGDTRLMEAHREATFAVFSTIERSAAQARFKTSEGIGYQQTGNLVVSLHHHDLSRAEDPQMHTHGVVMNMTQRLDGAWRSLASQIGRYNEASKCEINGFIEQVRHHNRYFSKLYETELAYRVKQLGYEITTDTPSGIFEIEGVSPEVIQYFSKRRNQIEAQLERMGLFGGKAASVATLITRDDKQDVDRVKLKEKWEEDAKKLGLDCKKIIDATYHKDKTQTVEQQAAPEINHEVSSAIQRAARGLSIFQTTFTLEEVISEASAYAIKNSLSVESLLAGVDMELSTGELISVSNTQGKTCLMAKSTLEDEKRLITQLNNNKALLPTVDGFHLAHYLVQHEEINPDCHAPLMSIFNKDRVVLLDGKSTKEALIEPIFNIAKSADLEVAILSPSLVGSRQLANEVKEPPQTFWEQIKAIFVDSTPKHYSVMQFLNNFKDDRNISTNKMPDILVVDNAHLLSTHQKANLLEWNTTHHTKLILLGDQKTLLPQQRGVALNELVEHGVKTITLPSKEDQKHDVATVLSSMLDNIVEVKINEDRHAAMATHFTNLSEKDRLSSWLVGQSKKSVDQLNSLAHQALVEQNKLTKLGQQKVLVPVFISEGKAAVAASYQKDQVVRFNESYSSLSIHRGEYLRVLQTHEKSNCVVLQKNDGNQIIWHPDRVAGKSLGKIEVFNEKNIDIGVGESIQFHRSIKSHQIVKGERFTVDDIRHQKMKLKSNDAKSVVIDLAKPYHRHIDYGYAATPHAIAHEKPNVLIAELPAKASQTDKRRFLQIASQPKVAWIYTDDHKNLAMQLDKKSGDRLTAHETLRKADDIKKNMHAMYDVLEKQISKRDGQHDIHTVKKSIDAMYYAMRHLAEREAVFTHKDLMKTAMQYAMGNVTEKQLTEVAVEMEKAGIILREKRSDGTLWTTAEAVKFEREILDLATRDKGSLRPIASDALLLKYCDPHSLRPEQIQAIKTITQSHDRVLSIQGRAGTGKTTMMVTLNDVLSSKELLDEGGYQLHGIAPTNKAVKELRVRGITAQTVDSFLFDMRRIQENKTTVDWSKTILVVDEASMVSNRKMLDVLKVVHDFNIREMISTGDTEQNAAIESGKPHDLIQRALGDTTILLQDIQRQKNPILKNAVKAIYQGDVKKTFSILGNLITEIKPTKEKKPHDIETGDTQAHYQKRVEAIVGDYIGLLTKGEDVQIIAPSHEDRRAVNNQVRHQLTTLNLLKGEDHTFSILSSQDMTGVERSEARNFIPGQMLRFVSYAGKGIKAGDYFTINSVKSHNMLVLTKPGSDKEVLWQIPRSQERLNNMVEVFKRSERDLKVGDKIAWTRTNKKEGTFCTDFAEVTHLENRLITVKRQDNSEFTFDGSDQQYQHWDHAYAITAYGAQGGTYSTVLALFESYRKNLMNLKNFLVTITRPVNTLRIYTDNKATLQENIEKNTGSKSSSMEVIGEFPDKHKTNNRAKENCKISKSITPASPQNSSKSTDKNNLKSSLPAAYRYDKLTIERIKEGLNRDVEKIAMDILGQPKMRGSHFLKFGTNQGSLSVTTKGERQGWWNDFSDSGGRSMLSFIQKHVNLDKQQALDFGAKWLGISLHAGEKNERFVIKKQDEKIQRQPDKKEEQEQKKKIEFAKKLAGESQPIKGTLAEKYLKEHRAISMEKYPDDIRFHAGIYSKLNGKKLPAMLVVARDQSGEIRAVQATYLDAASAKKIDKSVAAIQKQSFGLVKGATVNINGDKHAPTLVAEGTETGLSVASVIHKANVRITLSKSNFKNIDSKSLTEKTIFCLDNDGQNIKEDKLISESAKRLVEKNKQVAFMLPTHLKDQKQDYNDVLKQGGHYAIKRDYENTISFKELYGTMGNNHAGDLLSHHQKMMSHDKNNPATLAKTANHCLKETTLSDKIIANFTKETIHKHEQINKRNIEAYQSMQPIQHANGPAKTVTKIKDFEHEI